MKRSKPCTCGALDEAWCECRESAPRSPPTPSRELLGDVRQVGARFVGLRRERILR